MIVMVISIHEAFSTYLTYKVEPLLMAFHMQLIIISRGELFTAVFLLTSDKNFPLKEIQSVLFSTKMCFKVISKSHNVVK